jgi:uncharacterized protein DUF4389
MQPMPGPDPVRYEFDAPERVANWRPLVQWLLAIPHLVVLYLLQIASGVVWIISFFTVLFTQNVPEGLHNFQVMYLRYTARTHTYVSFMHETYPPFEFGTTAEDPGGFPVSLSVDRPAQMNRWLPLVKWLLAFPHYVVLTIYTIGAIFVVIAAFFVVLFTGKFPPGMRDYLVKYGRYYQRVYVYIMFLRDEYPSFSLQ